VRVRLMPNSSSCRLCGFFKDAEGQDFIKIAVISVPEKGKANKELVNYLSKSFKVAKSCIEIITGEFDKYKKVKISGDPRELSEKAETFGAGDKDDSSNY